MKLCRKCIMKKHYTSDVEDTIDFGPVIIELTKDPSDCECLCHEDDMYA